MLKVICLGRVCYDINLLVDSYPSEGSINEFFSKQGKEEGNKKGNIGGSIGTISCCLARWGINTSVATVLGNDVNGTRIRKVFDKLHIDTRYIEPSYDNDTQISLVLINKSTKKNIIYNLSDSFVSLKKCDFDFTPNLICVDGYDVVQSKNLLERFPHCLSVLDASLYTPEVTELVKKAKYAVCTKEFAESVAKEKMDFQDPSTLIKVYQILKKKYLNTEIVVTLGEKGAMYCINNQIKISPTLKVEVEDIHGAGSIFRAAFAYSLVNGNDVEKSVKLGCIAAGLSVQKVGAVDSIPSLEEIKDIYEQNY